MKKFSITAEVTTIYEIDVEAKNEKGVPLCPISGKEAIWVSQDAYFFKLSIFAEPLLNFFEENPKFIVPSSERINEIISLCKNVLNTFCANTHQIIKEQLYKNTINNDFFTCEV